MTAPDRIIADCGFVPAENAVATFASWDKLTEYVRADLARPTPLAEALAVPEVAREALMVERIDDVAEICRQFGLSEPRFRAALRAIGERADG